MTFDTFDKRLAALGVDLSDLPEPSTLVSRSLHLHSKTYDLIKSLYGDSWSGADRTRLFLSYILLLTDIIDRLETRLDNVIGERDYLVEKLSEAIGDCNICVYSDLNEAEMPCYQCNFPDRNFVFAGVPDDWMVHDDA